MENLRYRLTVMTMGLLLAAPISSFAQQWSVPLANPDYEIVNTGTVNSPVPFTIEGSTPQDTLFISSLGNVGLGTSTPGLGDLAPRLHIADDTPDIRLDDVDDSQVWNLFADFGGMGFFDETATTNPLYVESAAPTDSLYIDSTGQMGVGTENPLSKLHVSDNVNAQLRVEKTDAAATGDQFLFDITNASPAKVRFAITTNAAGARNIWTFDNNPVLDAFSISKVGTGLNEFLVKANGDGTFRGRSFATNHINTSSRNVKTDFALVDEQNILSKLAALPMSEWRYKDEEPGSRHIGPVAEDFQLAFGLGDGRTISTVDASGVALASIKAVHAQLLDRDKRLYEQQLLLEKQQQLLLKQQAQLERLEKAIDSVGGDRQ